MSCRSVLDRLLKLVMTVAASPPVLEDGAQQDEKVTLTNGDVRRPIASRPFACEKDRTQDAGSRPTSDESPPRYAKSSAVGTFRRAYSIAIWAISSGGRRPVCRSMSRWRSGTSSVSSRSCSASSIRSGSSWRASSCDVTCDPRQRGRRRQRRRQEQRRRQGQRQGQGQRRRQRVVGRRRPLGARPPRTYDGAR